MSHVSSGSSRRERRDFPAPFHPRGERICRARKKSAQHYAIRFAAKEAFFKAIGLGLRDGMSWHDVEVINNDLGKPDLGLGGRSKAILVNFS